MHCAERQMGYTYISRYLILNLHCVINNLNGIKDKMQLGIMNKGQKVDHFPLTEIQKVSV